MEEFIQVRTDFESRMRWMRDKQHNPLYKQCAALSVSEWLKAQGFGIICTYSWIMRSDLTHQLVYTSWLKELFLPTKNTPGPKQIVNFCYAPQADEIVLPDKCVAKKLNCIGGGWFIYYRDHPLSDKDYTSVVDTELVNAKGRMWYLLTKRGIAVPHRFENTGWYYCPLRNTIRRMN